MQYISTRGSAPKLDFEQATLTGLANDGGLYLPEYWPVFSNNEIRQMQGLEYTELATEILSTFTTNSIQRNDLEILVGNAYGNFHHSAIAPLKQLDSNIFFMELFHGPTLAFKDFALQLLGQFFQYFLDKNNTTCTIVGATSGDTGSAAIAGVRGLEALKLFMLHPKGRVSDVQRKQMTTVIDSNIHNLSMNGTFDDCQNMVKSLFNDHEFRQRHKLSAVNSINWARIAAQVVYYFRAALALGAPDRAISFSVPTGNFGNVLAGYVAKKMGLPIHKLIVGSNQNDILTRFFESGVMQMKGVTPTLSPSMDIQISSNFERYLFELLQRDSEHLNSLMTSFHETGEFSVDNSVLQKAKGDFNAFRLDDGQTAKDIKAVYQSTGEIIDPHSIIGVSAAKQEKDQSAPIVVLGTAHPAKFPDAIKQSIGVDCPLPHHVGDLMSLPEKSQDVENDKSEIQSLIDQT